MSILRLTFVQSERDNSTAWRQDWTWDDLATFLTTHQRLPAKGELGVIFARFVDGPCRRKARTGHCTEHCPGNDHRVDENVEAVTALGLDFDHAPADRLQALLGDLVARGRRFVTYTTWSSTPTAPKIRVVLALDAEVPAAQFRGFWDAVVDQFGIRDIVDKACCNPGRLFFTPQCPVEGVPMAQAYEGDAIATAPILARVTADPPRTMKEAAPPIPGALTLDSALAQWQPNAEIVGHDAERYADVECPWADEHTDGRRDARVFDINGVLGFKCLHSHCDGRDWHAFRQQYDHSHTPSVAQIDDGVDIFGDQPPVSAKPPTEPTRATYGIDALEYMGEDPGDSVDDWLIDGIVAAGAAQLVAGHPKAYKTFLLEYLAICIALGIDAFGRFKTRQSNCLLLPREDSVRETRRRLHLLVRGIAHQLGQDVDELKRALVGKLHIDTLQPFYWTDREHLERLARTIDAQRLGFIGVDSLSRTHLGDENSVKDMSPVVNIWSDIALEKGIAIPVIHHFTKSGSGSLLQQIRGSGSIGAVARHLIGVEKAVERGDPFELSFEGNLRGVPSPFKVAMVDGLDAAQRKILTFEYRDVCTLATSGTESVLDIVQREDYERVVLALRAHELRGEKNSRGDFTLSTHDVRPKGMGLPRTAKALDQARKQRLVEHGTAWGLTAAGRGFADSRR